jgi:hypothetical protein
MLLIGLDANSEHPPQWRVFKVHCGFGQLQFDSLPPLAFIWNIFSSAVVPLNCPLSGPHTIAFMKRMFQPSPLCSFNLRVLHHSSLFIFYSVRLDVPRDRRIPPVWIFNKTPKYKWRSCPLARNSVSCIYGSWKIKTPSFESALIKTANCLHKLLNMENM